MNKEVKKTSEGKKKKKKKKQISPPATRSKMSSRERAVSKFCARQHSSATKSCPALGNSYKIWGKPNFLLFAAKHQIKSFFFMECESEG